MRCKIKSTAKRCTLKRPHTSIHIVPQRYIWIKKDNINEIVTKAIKEMESYDIVKDGNNKISTCPMCFDTETTTYNDMAFIYSCQLQVGKLSLFAREYTVFVEFLYKLISKVRTTYLIGIANMSYDFSFMFAELQEIGKRLGIPFDFIATEPHQIICASLEFEGKAGIRFVDICKISGLSLAKTAEVYNLKHQKCDKIDYDKIRNSKTPLTIEELNYNMFDVLAGADFMEYLFNTYPKQGKRFPITATSIIRNEMKVIYADMHTKFKKGELPKGTIFNPNLYKELFPTSFKKYQEIRTHLFAGGYTHGNIFYLNQIVKNTTCVDESSAYPAVMMQEEFPMTKFEPIKPTDFRRYFGEFKDWQLPALKLPKGFCAYFKISFKNIRQRTMHSYISNDKNKLYYVEKPVVDNGRIASADFITIMCTNVDYDTIRKLYNAQGFRIEECYIAKTARLPEYVLTPLINAFVSKTQLKIKGLDGTQEYQASKGVLNSGYGCMVQKLELGNMDLVFDDMSNTFEFKEELIGSENSKIYIRKMAQNRERICREYGVVCTDDAQFEDFLSTNDNAKAKWILAQYEEMQEVSYFKAKINAILSPFWGIWVTSYARNRLVTMMMKVEKEQPNCVVYYDTDSLYIKDFENVKHIIDARNKELEAWNLNHLPEECVSIGQWDIDPACNMKHLGAKRYLKQNLDPKAIKKKGEWTATIAGLPKKDFKKFIEQNAGISPFELFEPRMTIDLVLSSKLTAVYMMQPYSTEVIDDKGNREIMHHETGVVLKKVPFAIQALEDYLRISNSMRENYLHCTA